MHWLPPNPDPSGGAGCSAVLLSAVLPPRDHSCRADNSSAFFFPSSPPRVVRSRELAVWLTLQAGSGEGSLLGAPQAAESPAELGV